MSNGTSPEWLKDLRDEIQSQAIDEALSDVPDTGVDSAATWVKREPHGAHDKETVFVLAGRLLHRLSGDVDPMEREPQWEGTSTSTYDVLLISDKSNYQIRLERGGAANNVAWTKRWWTFEFNPDEAGLEIEYSTGTGPHQTSGPDPTMFARALVAAIAAAQSPASGEDR